MTLGSYFYIEYLGIEVWSYFHGWQEYMTGICPTRERGMYVLIFRYLLFLMRIEAQYFLPYISYKCLLVNM
jgi:hypothetical protein